MTRMAVVIHNTIWYFDPLLMHLSHLISGRRDAWPELNKSISSGLPRTIRLGVGW